MEDNTERVEPNPDVLKFIVTRDYTQFKSWCRKFNINPRHPNVVHLSSLHRLHGIGHKLPVEFWLVGQWDMWGGTGSAGSAMRSQLHQRIYELQAYNPHVKVITEDLG